MSNKHSRQTVFVCVGLSDSLNIISKIIEADTVSAASSSYEDEFKIKPQEILGPFYKKKAQVLENTVAIKFSNMQFTKAVYNDWAVNAFMLSEPPDHAYLVFTNHLHDKKGVAPRGTIVVPISQLRFINE